jgi:hypothetical protein
MLWETARDTMWELAALFGKSEQNSGVLRFCADFLARVLHVDPARVEELTSQILPRALDRGKKADEEILAAIGSITAILWVTHARDRSHALLDEWLANPATYEAQLGHALHSIRDGLVTGYGSDDAKDAAIRQRCQQFAARLVEATATGMQQGFDQSLTERTEPAKERVQKLAKLLDEMGDQFFFASGAFRNQQAGDGEPLGDDTLKKQFLDDNHSTFHRIGDVGIGAAYRDPLEHTTRKYMIDEILSSLGWNLGRLTQEMVEEARLQGDSTLFLDYLGVNPAQGSPLAIVEAKAWAKPFVTASDLGAAGALRANPSSIQDLVAQAIQHCKTGGQPKDSPVALEWAKWIAKLHQYVTTLHTQSGQVVKRLAITSGRWWIIFAAPNDSFVAQGSASPDSIFVFEGREVIERSDEIFNLLGRPGLIADPPSPIAPTQLSAYTDRASVVRLYHALWVARKKDGAHFDALSRKKRSISFVASGPSGSAYEPAELPPDQAWPAPWIFQCSRISRPPSAWVVRV